VTIRSRISFLLGRIGWYAVPNRHPCDISGR
jgi:hypothetical protein